MNSHELAKILLSLPDLPVATYANGHNYSSVNDRMSHGALKVATKYNTIFIGNMYLENGYELLYKAE